MFLQLVGAVAIGGYLYALAQMDQPPVVNIVNTFNPWSPAFNKPGPEQPQHRVVNRYVTVDPSTGLPVEIREFENGYRTMVGIDVASTGPDVRDYRGPPPQ